LGFGIDIDAEWDWVAKTMRRLEINEIYNIKQLGEEDGSKQRLRKTETLSRSMVEGETELTF